MIRKRVRSRRDVQRGPIVSTRAVFVQSSFQTKYSNVRIKVLVLAQSATWRTQKHVMGT